MKRATTSSESEKWKKKEEASGSPLRQNKQSKLKVKQEVLTAESDGTDSDYAEFLRTYDPGKEYADSSESSSKADKESPKTEESKNEDSESKSDVESK
ncbi:hypothetical protein P8452_17519 [Trifolium repens]|jgi:hypothetical protein|nr:hypothetical protein P8452_17519 [Trifolium repens]